MASDEEAEDIPIGGSGNLSAETLVEALAESAEVIRDTSSVAPSDGRVVKDAVTGEVYVGDGDQFVSTRDSLGVSVPILDTERLSTKGKPWHDVTSYGAEGDGSTDDSQAFDDAQGADSEFRVVYVPEGDYLIDQNVLLTNNTWWVGDGWPNGTRIIPGPNLTSSSSPVAAFYSREADGILDNVRWRYLEFDASQGWDGESYDAEQKHIFLRHGRDIEHAYCYVHDTPATGLGFDALRRSSKHHNYIKDCGTDGYKSGSNGIGYGVRNPGGEFDKAGMWINDNIIEGCADLAWGITLEDVGGPQKGLYVVNNYVDGKHRSHGGISVERTIGGVVSGNTVTRCNNYGIFFGTVDGGRPRYCSAVGNAIIGDRIENDMERGGLVFAEETDPNGNSGRADEIPENCHAYGNVVRDPATRINNGTRCTMAGLGENGTDNPAGAGDWAARPIPGIAVKWDNGGTPTLSRFVGGSWLSQTLSSEQTNFEDFESDLSAYSGDTGSFSVDTNSPVFEGSQSLKGTAASGAGNGIASTSVGTISEGDVLRWTSQVSDANDFQYTYFMAQSATASPDGYILTLEPAGDRIRLAKRVGGSFNKLDSSTGPIQSFDFTDYLDTGLECEVRCLGGHEFWATVSTTAGEQLTTLWARDGDSNFTSGGIGFTARNTDGTASTHVWDGVTID